MSKPTLTNADFERVARKLKCSVAAIKAVSEVESRGQGFYSNDFPVILFERHIFRKYTQGRYNKTHSRLSGPAGNYGAAGQNQRNKFNDAFALNPDAAMKACSWGKFQIMGFNHDVCGFATVGGFVDAMKESEGKHLDAFAAFVISNNLARYLRSLDWAAFASRYNGAGYRKNRYDTKMAQSYAKYSKTSAAISMPDLSAMTSPKKSKDALASDLVDSAGQSDSLPPIDSGNDQVIEPPPIVQPQDEVTKSETIPTAEGGEEIVTVTTKNEQDVNEPVTQDGPKPYNEIGLKDTLIGDAKPFLPANGGLQMLSEYAQQATGWPPWVIALIGKAAIILLVVTTGWVIYRFASWLLHNWRENEKMKLLALINTDTHRKDLKFDGKLLKDQK